MDRRGGKRWGGAGVGAVLNARGPRNGRRSEKTPAGVQSSYLRETCFAFSAEYCPLLLCGRPRFPIANI